MDLGERWAALLSRWAEPAEAAAAGESLLARYDEPHRRYHTTTHLAAVVDQLFLDLAEDPVAVELAAFFHDAVYDPRAPAGLNERESALLAASSLASLGVPSRTVEHVRRLVLTTADHRASGEDADAAVLNDADLAVLGLPPADYEAYAASVRAEYVWLNDDLWRGGRSEVLTALLSRPTLYATVRGRERWEDRARANLRAELAALTRL